MWKNPCLMVDAYKLAHYFMQPPGVNTVYSTWTARSNKYDPECPHTVVFGQQHFIKRYLVDFFNKEFFGGDIDFIRCDFERKVNNIFSPLYGKFDRFQALYELGYLPIHVLGVPEGTVLPVRIPDHVIYNTHHDFSWLPQYLEDIWSCNNWLPSTSATTAYYRRLALKPYAEESCDNPTEVLRHMCGDFSMRGMENEDAAYLSSAGHLLSFDRTATVEANGLLEQYYMADIENSPPGLGIPSLEHSVVCQGIAYFKHKIKQGDIEDKYKPYILKANSWDVDLIAEMCYMIYLLTEVQPKGLFTYVADTNDYWAVLTKVLPLIKSIIESRDGCLSIRPDSGDPVKIVCGDESAATEYERSGSVEWLGKVFGFTTNTQGFKELPPYIRLIYGDAITYDRTHNIAIGLLARRFALNNISLGIGAFTYQYVTRDTRGFAIKATHCEIEGIGELPLSKNPKTDDGVKKSLSGTVSVYSEDDEYKCRTFESIEESLRDPDNIMRTVFIDGTTQNNESIYNIRNRLWNGGF